MVWILGGIWSKFRCMSHKIIKWRGRPLPSMVFDNPWFYSMVWLQGTLYLSHPWYFTNHGFDPWYGPKAHCNNVMKKLYAFSIRHSRIFYILHFSYSIALLGYWFWVSFLVWFERWGSKNSLWASPLHVAYLLMFHCLRYSYHISHWCVFLIVVHYVISYPPLSASNPSGSHPPRSRSVVLEQVHSPWEWGFEHSLGSKICRYFQPPFGTLIVHFSAI